MHPLNPSCYAYVMLISVVALQMLMNPLLERLEDSVNKNNEILDALTQSVFLCYMTAKPKY